MEFFHVVIVNPHSYIKRLILAQPAVCFGFMFWKKVYPKIYGYIKEWCLGIKHMTYQEFGLFVK